MAKIIKHSPGPTQPMQSISRGSRGRYIIQDFRGIQVGKSWPRKRGPSGTPGQLETRANFKRLVKYVQDMMPEDHEGAMRIAEGSVWTWRDVLSVAIQGKLIILDNGDPFLVQNGLNHLSQTPGAMAYRGDDDWLGLIPPAADAVLAFDVATHQPVWLEGFTSGIDELTGDLTAGPGSGAQAATLAPSGVTAGTYDRATIEVDAKGRVVEAISNPGPDAITQLTGDVTAGPGVGSVSSTLAASGVTAGTYSNATVEVDAKGRVILASNGSGGGAATGAVNLALAGTSSSFNVGGTGWTAYKAATWANPGGGTFTKYALGFQITNATPGQAAIIFKNNSGNGYACIFQTDANLVLYRFTPTVQTFFGALNLGGGGAASNQVGKHSFSFSLDIHGGPNNHFSAIFGSMNGYILDRQDNTYDFTAGTWELFAGITGNAALGTLWMVDPYANPYSA